MKYLFSGCIFLLTNYCVLAQESRITNITPDKENSKVQIEYEIVGNSDKELYEVFLYSSINDFKTPLDLEQRKLGQGLSDNPNIRKPGKYTVTWDYSKDIYSNQKVTFELGVRLIFDPFFLEVKGQPKRNKPIEVRWTGGKDNDEITLTLMNADKEITRQTIGFNTKNYTFPKPEQKGKGYYIEIKNNKYGDEENTNRTEDFKIKPSIPFIVKIIPFVAGAAFAAYVYLTYEPPLDPLPAPPEPN